MNNEEKILALLETMQADIAQLKQNQDKTNTVIANMDKKMEKGFANLENSINIMGRDVAKIEKGLMVHEAKPMH